MDTATLDYYTTHAEELVRRYETTRSPLADHFVTSFPPGGRILDIGCGSGRDLAELAHQGFQVFGVDGAKPLVRLAQKQHPELRGKIQQALLPDFAAPFEGGFDGVLCSAVLMHLDTSEQLNAVLTLRRCLKVDGRLLVSVPAERADVAENGRDANGRLFRTYPPADWQRIFERLGFTLIEQWRNTDALGRDGITWISSLWRLAASADTSPVQQIEAILRQDRKSTTYKFALLRALAELARHHPGSATMHTAGRMALAVREVAECWLRYYWPIIASPTFIPQLNGEQPDSAKALRFRGSLQALVSLYAHSGGYRGLDAQRQTGSLNTADQRLLDTVLAEIDSAIVQGPVLYAGGSLPTGRIFGYDTVRQQILIPDKLWLELDQLGEWVAEAAIQQWADKTCRLNHDLELAAVLRLLRAPGS